MRKTIIIFILTLFLFYTRIVGLDWGLPYPMHPDERNMAVAVQQLDCKAISNSNFQIPSNITNLKSQIADCMNPHFFAYGQFPLYLAWLGIQIFHVFAGVSQTITFEEATIALRIISALASILNAFVLLKIFEFITNRNSKIKIQNSKIQLKYITFQKVKDLVRKFELCGLRFEFIVAILIIIFSPYTIQLSHFGTTESLLMLLYSLIILYSYQIIIRKKQSDLYLLGLFSGLAIATKVSSLIFLGVPFGILFYLLIRTGVRSRKEIKHMLLSMIKLGGIILIVAFFCSPHTYLSFSDFISSLNYESAIATGSYVAFYTRQFVNTIPILFQFTHIFPYALGIPQFTLFLLGFFFLPWSNRNKKNTRIGVFFPTWDARRVGHPPEEHNIHLSIFFNLLRFSFLLYFLPTSFLFAKWTRFMAPLFPVMTLFAIAFLLYMYQFAIFSFHVLSKYRLKNWVLKIGYFTLILLTILPGVAYLSIYQNPDVRFTASNWIYEHIPENSRILSETANVIDIPVPNHLSPKPRSYDMVQFDFYSLDENPALPYQLDQLVEAADYIIVPSRRIFTNHTNQKPSQNSKFKTQNSISLTYPQLNEYYDKLFSGTLGFEQVAKFSSYPKITFLGKTFIEFQDEMAEETWSVFDHPVIRIYKKITNNKIQNSSKKPYLDFTDYEIIDYQIQSKNYRLLVADTPSKWEQGLMYVRSTSDIRGADGMIFLFNDASVKSFWNKNTVSDLDVYWILDDAVVGTGFLPSIEKSNSLVTISSPKGVNKVVEIVK